MFRTPPANELGKAAYNAWSVSPGKFRILLSWVDLPEREKEAWRFIGLAVAQIVQKANETTKDNRIKS